MQAMQTFNPQSAPLTFTGATTAPTSVQPRVASGVQSTQFRISNESATISCLVGWGASDTIAKANAAGLNASCAVVVPFGVADVMAPVGSFFSGITPSSTAIIYVQAGLIS